MDCPLVVDKTACVWVQMFSDIVSRGKQWRAFNKKQFFHSVRKSGDYSRSHIAGYPAVTLHIESRNRLAGIFLNSLAYENEII